MAEISRLPGALSDNWEWQLHAACRGLPSDTFFPPDRERGARRRHREANARAICGRCPVALECLAHSLQVREPYGVWGGLSENERQKVLAGDSAGSVIDRVARLKAQPAIAGM